MPDQPHPLAQLPNQLSFLTGAVARAGVSLAHASEEMVYRPPAYARMYLLQSALAKWRIRIAQTSSHTVFFFIHREDTFVVMDARVQCLLVTAEPGSVAAEPQLAWQVSYPEFLLTNLTPAEFSVFAPPAPDLTKTTIVALDPTGQDLLAVEFSKRPRIRYSPGRIPGAVEQGPYSLVPLLALLDAARHWDDGDWPIGAGREPRPGGNGAVQEVVESFTQAYVSIGAQLAEVPTVSIGDVELACYRIADYSADITVKIREDGELAQKASEEAHRVDLTLRVPDTLPHVAHVVPAVPVLEVEGDLYNSFFETLKAGAMFFAALLGISGSSGVRSLLAGQFIESAREDTLIFFAGTDGDMNIYLLRMRGQLTGNPTTLIFAGVFKQFSDTKVEWFPDGVNEVIARFTGSADRIGVAKEHVKYFLVPLQNLRHWEEML